MASRLAGAWFSLRTLQRHRYAQVECVCPSLQHEPRVVTELIGQWLGRLHLCEKRVDACLVFKVLVVDDDALLECVLARARAELEPLAVVLLPREARLVGLEHVVHGCITDVEGGVTQPRLVHADDRLFSEHPCSQLLLDSRYRLRFAPP